jgi:hypothetical protein
MTKEYLHEKRFHNKEEANLQVGIEEYRNLKRKDNLNKITGNNIRIDVEHKALTGRKPEDYSKESGISLDELFPKDGEVLNIGDPWQAIDMEHVTTIEYESGREASFCYTKEQFNRILEYNTKKIQDILNLLLIKNDNHHSVVNFINKTKENLALIPDISIKGYDSFSESWLELSDFFNNEIRSILNTEEWLSDEVKNIWHSLQAIAWAYKDMYLNHSVIEPTILAEAIRRKGLSSSDEYKIRQGLITQNRFRMKQNETEYIKDVFPSHDLADDSFDRIIASWSISTHAFEEMTSEEFLECWDEIDRILKKDGVAYMWPIYNGNERCLMKSISDYCASGGSVAVVDNNYYRENEDSKERLIWFSGSDENFLNISDILEYSGVTLIICPRWSSQDVKKRIENHVLFDK